MLEQLRFYARHSFNDLKVNGQRTFFALLCIAAGVAAIVSLQTLAAMIGDTLTGNLQQNNRGDIQFIAGNNFTGDGDLIQQGVDDGIILEETMSFFGQQNSTYYINPQAIDGAIRSWAEEHKDEYDGDIEITYRPKRQDKCQSQDHQVHRLSGTSRDIRFPQRHESQHRRY